MARGRPAGSQIRQNLVNMLHVLGKAYGYELYRLYTGLFAPCTLRVIYYHLHKGVATGEFCLDLVRQEKGRYSWGPLTEKHYYRLGQSARPTADRRLLNRIRAFAGRSQPVFHLSEKANQGK